MPEEDEQLSLSWHVVSIFKKVYFVQHLVAGMLVWKLEVVISNPESQVVVGTLDVVKTVCGPIGSLIGSVEAFNHLLEWSELF